MAGVTKHFTAKLRILDLLVQQVDRFVASIESAPLEGHQAAELDELQRALDLAKMSPRRQVSWYEAHKDDGTVFVRHKKQKRHTREALIKSRVFKAQELLREVGLELTVRDNYYVVLEQHRDIHHTLSATYLLAYAKQQNKLRKIPVRPRPLTK